jgi:hypothetical protein
VLENGNSPGSFCSYRGYYEDLSIVAGSKPMLVGQFALSLKQQIGRFHQGWKGGDYMTDEDTALWVADDGCCGNAVSGVSKKDSETFVITTTEHVW